jgi:hypothetical protein
MIFKIVEDFEKNTTQFDVLSADDADDIAWETLKSFRSYPEADAFVAFLLEGERRTFYDKLLKREKKGEKEAL